MGGAPYKYAKEGWGGGGSFSSVSESVHVSALKKTIKQTLP